MSLSFFFFLLQCRMSLSLLSYRDGQMVFRPSCLLGNHSPQFGCPCLITGGIIVSIHIRTRKIQLPTGQPRFLLWLPSSIFWLSRATGLDLPHFSIPMTYIKNVYAPCCILTIKGHKGGSGTEWDIYRLQEDYYAQHSGAGMEC